MNNNDNGILYIDGKPFDGLEPIEVTPCIDFDATMQHIHEKVGATTGLRADLLAAQPEEQDTLYEAARRLRAALGETVDAIVEVFRQFTKKVTAAANEVVGPLAELLRVCSEHQEELRSVATPRQWHLYLHGKPRVSKKWEHVFEKRLAQQKKKGGHAGAISKI